MKNNITGKINLAMLTGSVKKMKGKSGEIDCLVIPIELNHLFKGEKGIYLDIIAFELEKKNADQKDTHLIKQSLNKEVRESMSEEALKAMPILGNLTVWGEGSRSEPEPKMNMEATTEEDDLPF